MHVRDAVIDRGNDSPAVAGEESSKLATCSGRKKRAQKSETTRLRVFKAMALARVASLSISC